MPRRPLVVAVALAATSTVAQGLARFGYGLVLPVMREDLGWSYATAGSLSTANAVGYLVGSVGALAVARRLGAVLAFRVTVLAVVLTVAAGALTGDLAVQLVLRFLAGATSAVAFVLAAAVASRLRTADGRSGPFLAVYFAGAGAGIVLSGVFVPLAAAAASSPAEAWRYAWPALAVPAVLLLPVMWWAFRESDLPPAASARDRSALRRISPLVASYTLFGVGYIGYMTFVPDLLRGQGLGDAGIAAFWIALGLASVVVTPLGAPLLRHLPPAAGVAGLLAATAVAGALPVLVGGVGAAWISGIVFGASFLTAITALADAARRVLDPRHWTASLAVLTTGFALGQCLGPVLSGLVSDAGGGLETGLSVSAGVLGVAALVGLLQRTPRTERVGNSAP
ncbi:YbfB/YjiJ family MFS transporter [Actinomycetospora sp. CA-101289]|uniref:YbfB/YjiJ family MFS transporter n=1 Tax=Actinomycetospora sp. CA-101289 TaxID=3239893 RepID=UPI003D976988